MLAAKKTRGSKRSARNSAVKHEGLLPLGVFLTGTYSRPDVWYARLISSERRGEIPNAAINFTTGRRRLVIFVVFFSQKTTRTPASISEERSLPKRRKNCEGPLSERKDWREGCVFWDSCKKS